MVIGGLLFASVFVGFAMHFGDFTNFNSFVKSSMLRALGGMGLLFVGGLMRGVGARGLAGSGVVLDPDKARDDLAPYTRMTGGIIKDVLDEAQIDLSGTKKKVVLIKCQKCGKLNEEDSKFCQECGARL